MVRERHCVCMNDIDARKTTKEKQDEERLLEELLEVVSLRNNIVDSIEVDRLRFALVQLSSVYFNKTLQ